MNPKNNDDSFQYELAFTQHYEEIKTHRKRTSNFKPFIV